VKMKKRYGRSDARMSAAKGSRIGYRRGSGDVELWHFEYSTLNSALDLSQDQEIEERLRKNLSVLLKNTVQSESQHSPPCHWAKTEL
jgi:hypothetical protein